MDAESVINFLKVERDIREKKIEMLQNELNSIRHTITALTPRDPELERLLDEEERIEAEARVNQL